jgi:bifunctional non-homologous end joining protein LigD
MIVDLDPPSDTWERAFPDVRWAARLLRDGFERLGLTAFVMTSGSKGLHVHVPLVRGPAFDEVRTIARGLAVLLARRYPDRLTVEQRKEKRGDRIYLDVGRNAYAQKAVAPYAVRARPGAPVATPITWDELVMGAMEARRYDIRNIRRRLGQRDDPWKDMERSAGDLDRAQHALDEMVATAAPF